MLCFLLANFSRGWLISKCRKKAISFRIYRHIFEREKKCSLSSFPFQRIFFVFHYLLSTLMSTTSNRKIKVNTLCKLRQKMLSQERSKETARAIISFFPYFTALCASYISFTLFVTTYSIFLFLVLSFSVPVTVEMYTELDYYVFENRHYPNSCIDMNRYFSVFAMRQNKVLEMVTFFDVIIRRTYTPVLAHCVFLFLD